MADNKIEIEIVLDDGTIKKGFATISNEAKKTAKNVQGEFSASKLISGVAIGNVLASAVISGFRTAFNGISGLIKTSVNAAAQNEVNISRLNSALINTGQFSKAASDSLVGLSEQLQQFSSFSSDAILNAESLLLQIGRIGKDQMPAATQATLDLASALRIDLDSAARLVAKSAAGNVEAFKKYGITINKGFTDTQTFANALQTLQQRFGGSAARDVDTFVGITTQLGNAYNQVTQEFGKIITNSPTVIAVFKIITKAFNDLSTYIKTISGSGDIFKTLTDSATKVGLMLINFVVMPIEVVVSSIETMLSAILTFASAIPTIYAKLASSVTNILNKFGLVSDETKQKLQSVADTASNVTLSLADTTKDFYTNATQPTFADKLSNGLIDLKTQLDTTREQIRLTKQEIVDQSAFPEGTSIIPLSVSDSFSNFATGFSAQLKALTQNAAQSFQQIGAQATNTLGKGVGNAFAAMGSALARGENAMKAFVKAFLGAVGQVAIQLGTEMILRGIAYSFDPFMEGYGPPLIAAGAALATFGGVLSAVGGGGATASGGAGATNGGFVESGTTESFEPVEEKPKTEIAVNILGSVLDRRETGLEIAKIIQENFDTNDVIMARA